LGRRRGEGGKRKKGDLKRAERRHHGARKKLVLLSPTIWFGVDATRSD
jgi:hypothetical protein